MKKFVSLLFVVIGFSFSAAAQKIDLNLKYHGEVNVGFATSGKVDIEHIGKLHSNLSRPYIETIHGVSITKYAFIGAGAGFQYFYGRALSKYLTDETWNTMSIPLFLNMKGLYPAKNGITPFVSLSFGGSIVPYSGAYNLVVISGAEKTISKLGGGFYCDFGAGVRYKCFNIGIGLQYQEFVYNVTYADSEYSYIDGVDASMKFTSFYVKLGFCFK